jgi:hypothetical protein
MFSFLTQKSTSFMKKAKLLLTGIAVLAIVGGALAFKAKSAFNKNYCTSDTSGTCPNFASAKKGGTSGTIIYYVTTAGTDCSEAPNCAGLQSPSTGITTATTFPLVQD